MKTKPISNVKISDDREYGYKIKQYYYNSDNGHYAEMVTGKSDTKGKSIGLEVEFYKYFKDQMTLDLHKLNKHIVSLDEYLNNLLQNSNKKEGNNKGYVKINSFKNPTDEEIDEYVEDGKLNLNPDKRVKKEYSESIYYEKNKPICKLEGSGVIISEIPYIKTPERSTHIILYKLDKDVKAVDGSISDEEMERCASFFKKSLDGIVYQYKDVVDLTYGTSLYN